MSVVGLAGKSKKMVTLSEVNLDDPQTLSAVRKVLEHYDSSATDVEPICFLLTGNFASNSALAGTNTGTMEYKELFDALAAVLSDFPSLLRHSTWIFVPGDNDPWPSAFSAGASTLVPRGAVPEVFTNRIRRAFANAKTEAGITKNNELDGDAGWTSNPARLSLFGPAHEMVVFRDDLSGRMRRNAVRIGTATKQQENTANARNADDVMQEDVTMSGAIPTTEDDTQQTDTTTIGETPPITSTLTHTSSSAADDYDTAQAKKLILSLLPQSTLSPLPITTRPIHCDHATAFSALSLYPLPNTLILADAEAEPFAITFDGCHIINPGRLVRMEGRKVKARWVEYDLWS